MTELGKAGMSTREKMAKEAADKACDPLENNYGVDRTYFIAGFKEGFAAGAESIRERAILAAVNGYARAKDLGFSECDCWIALLEAIRALPLDEGSEGT